MSVYQRYPPEIKMQAIQLRRKGYSLDELSVQLHVPKTTVQGWVRSVSLSTEARNRIHSRVVAAARIGQPLAVIANRKKIEDWKQGIREEVRAIVQNVTLSPVLGKLLCALLYICEGAKYPSTQGMRFGNSDPQMIRFFLQLLRTYFVIDEQRLRGEVGHRCDQSQKLLIQYWSKVTGIPESHFYRRKPDLRTMGKITKRQDYKGVCAVQYSSTTLQFTLQSLGEEALKMVEPERVELSPPRCHRGALPLRHGPTLISRL